VENFFVVQCVKPCNRKAIDKARKNTGAVAFFHRQTAGRHNRVARRSRATKHTVKLRITKANEKRYGEVSSKGTSMVMRCGFTNLCYYDLYRS